MPNNTVEINFSNNKIKVITLNSFDSSLESVEKLDLSQNQIEDLQTAVFSNFNNLQVLHLEHNAIKTVDMDVSDLYNFFATVHVWEN